MTESTYLNSRVIKRALPVFQGRPPSNAPKMKRLFLAQGELAQIYDGAEGIRYLASVELRAGAVRGNHYHNIKDEVIYVIQGEILLVVEDILSKERASFNLCNGELAVIPVRIAHGFRTITSGQGVEWSATRFDPADICPYPLVQ